MYGLTYFCSILCIPIVLGKSSRMVEIVYQLILSSSLKTPVAASGKGLDIQVSMYQTVLVFANRQLFVVDV